MYILVALAPVVALVFMELWTGTAGLTYDHRVQRRKSPGPYWFIIGMQIFCAAMVTIAALGAEMGF
ncbi:MAG: hypothetical protein ACI9G1_003187 [Pirellulaceae bacterium]|jgi:hypothetical protein